MRQYVAKLCAASVLGGCSIIYNPSSITGDARVIDVEMVTDINPSLLELDSVFPDTVTEGMGSTGTGSAPAIVVLKGHQIAPDAMVTATADKGTVTVKDFKVAHDANWVAVVLEVPIDMTNDEAAAAGTVTITVTQNGGATTATQTVMLKFLDQLTATIMDPPATGKTYSKIDVGALMFTKNSAKRLVLRSTSDIKIASIDASGGTPGAGPGGCAGGAIGASSAAANADGITCKGRGLGVGGTLGAGGGGGGYVVAGGTGAAGGGAGGPMTGDEHVATYDTNNSAGGGGGSPTTVLAGQPGGGAGGMVQLDSRGNLAITGKIDVKGGVGGNSAGLSGSGGGGAGGTVVVRGFGMVSIGSVDLTGGAGGSTGNVGGAGRDGRMRIDAAKGTVLANAYAGPMIVDPPAYSTAKGVMLDVVGTALTGDAELRVYKPDGNLVDNMSVYPINFGTNGKSQPVIQLGPGYNKVCSTVGGGSPSPDDEATNCVEIAYLP